MNHLTYDDLIYLACAVREDYEEDAFNAEHNGQKLSPSLDQYKRSLYKRLRSEIADINAEAKPF